MGPMSVPELNLRPALFAVVPFVIIALLLASIRIHTTWSYYRTLRQFTEQPQAGQKIVTPPQIPYTLPFLGNSFSFLAPYPGQYWDQLLRWHPRSTGICSLLMGGRKTHILFSPIAVQALFKTQSASRVAFEHDLFTQVFGMPEE